MNRPIRMTIAGFSDAERQALHDFFMRLSGPGSQFEMAALPQQADVVVADGANTAHLRQLKAMRLSAQVLLIGASAEFPDLSFERRPINLQDVLQAVQYLLGVFEGRGNGPRPVAEAAATQPLPLQAVKSTAAPKSASAVDFAATQPFQVLSKGAAAVNFEATQPMTMKGKGASAVNFEATQPFKVLPKSAPGVSFEATQPMGFDTLFQQMAVDAQPAWKEDGGIQEDEIAAFKAARATSPLAENGPIIAERVELRDPDAPVPVRAPAPHNNAYDSTQSFLGIEAPPPAPVAERKGPHALLVDDSDVDARRVERLLTYMNYNVVRVRNAKDAVKRAGEQAFAFALVDTALDGGGYGHCRTIRQSLRAKSPSAVLIALGRVGGTFERLRAKLAGCSACIVKPIDLAKLEALVESLETSDARPLQRR